MSFQYLPGTKVTVLNPLSLPVGEAIIDKYLIGERAYYVWYIYRLADQKEYIKIPEWRLVRLNKF